MPRRNRLTIAPAQPAPAAAEAGQRDPLMELLARALNRAPAGPARRWLERLLRDGEAASGQGAEPAARAARPRRAQAPGRRGEAGQETEKRA